MKLIDIMQHAYLTNLNVLCHSIVDDQRVWVCPKYKGSVVPFPLDMELNPVKLPWQDFEGYCPFTSGTHEFTELCSDDDYIIDFQFM